MWEVGLEPHNTPSSQGSRTLEDDLASGMVGGHSYRGSSQETILIPDTPLPSLIQSGGLIPFEGLAASGIRRAGHFWASCISLSLPCSPSVPFLCAPSHSPLGRRCVPQRIMDRRRQDLETVSDLCTLGSVLTLQGLGTLLPQAWLLLPLLFPLGKKATKLSGEGSSVDVIKWGDCCHLRTGPGGSGSLTGA